MYLFKKSRYLFSFGIVLVSVFLFIIIRAQRSKPNVDLTEVAQESVFNVFKRDVQSPRVEDPPPNSYYDGSPSGPLVKSTPIPGTLVISFAEDGFSPDFAGAVQGQNAMWVNNTGTDIFIKELIEKHSEFESGITIAAGQSYEQKLYNTHLWSFKEVGSGKIGKIFIKPN